ncbi:dual specificity protein phosphatase, partial [Baffinella frigidus]
SYRGYCKDFGPTDLAGVVSFCRKVRVMLQDPRRLGRPAVYCTASNSTWISETLANVAFLFGAYLVLVKGKSPEDAAAPFSRIQPSPFKAFRDATHLESDFDLSLLDCLRGLERGARAGFFDLETFDVEQFNRDDALGLSVMCPKFVAFKGPVSGRDRPSYALEPEEFLDRFQELGVSDVVRLNEASTYHSEVFVEAGMRHHEMHFPDCSVPPLEIALQFLEARISCQGVIAVHCLAG